MCIRDRPGAQIGELSQDTYVVPDCVVWRQSGVWRAALARNHLPRINIHRGYEQMIRQCNENDAGYLRGHLQEARWLLKSLEARGDTLLRVTRCLLRQQAGFLEFGEQALRPLTLREVALEVGSVSYTHLDVYKRQRRRRCRARIVRPAAGYAGPHRRPAWRGPPMNWRLGLGLVLLVAALFSGWSAWKQRGVEEAPVAATDRSDYLMRDFEMISLDDKGQESITLRAPEMQRNARDQTFQIATPLFLLPDSEGRHWEMRSATAWVSPKGCLLYTSRCV